ncbi:unnamed protein product [Paramecium octaurelia]|uniref:Uncharacterized protein n=1 Tax=Paramecium octaurelia TaxID=43137 RepID=A0A8S1UX19_PAROT|nr:unnamed protein product [Paramecium octaurelia]
MTISIKSTQLSCRMKKQIIQSYTVHRNTKIGEAIQYYIKINSEHSQLKQETNKTDSIQESINHQN